MSRISKSKGTFNPERASAHFQQYMKMHNLNYTGMAIECGVNRRTISSICSAEDKPYNIDTFNDITKRLGGICDYWLGLTECQTWEEYDVFAETQAIQEESEKERIKSNMREQWRTIFYQLGYNYKYLGGTAEYDFAPEGSYLALHPQHLHQLTSFQEPSKHYHFNQEELDALISQLKDAIAFACFKKERATQQKERPQDGNRNTGM